MLYYSQSKVLLFYEDAYNRIADRMIVLQIECCKSAVSLYLAVLDKDT